MQGGGMLMIPVVMLLVFGGIVFGSHEQKKADARHHRPRAEHVEERR